MMNLLKAVDESEKVSQWLYVRGLVYQVLGKYVVCDIV